MSSSVPLYAPLGNYNTPSSGSVRAPFSVPGSVHDIRLIPEFGSCGNVALSHGMVNSQMNDGYFKLCAAYPNCGNSCVKYVSRTCPGQQMQNLQ